MEHFSHQIEIMIIKIKFIIEDEDFIDLSNLDQIVEDQRISEILFRKCSTEFKGLKYLNFSSCYDNQQLTFIDANLISFSSNIFELNVQVDSLEDCLYILDGPFHQMEKFSIAICGIDSKPIMTHQNVS
jgi:hypothetical protein